MTQQEFFERYTYNVRTDKIGGGSFGTVYKAEDNVLHRKVAIKVSEVKVINGKEFSLKDEFEAIKSLPEHSNIANYENLYTFEMPNGVFDYAVMQFYEDGNLSDAIKQSLSFEQKEQIATDLLQGIIHLHQHNVVHRDLKPGNILVVNRGNKIIPVITDFGLSKQVFQDGQSRFSNSFGGGTLKYSSPEQLRGEELRLNTDLWSYGVIVHQIFTGKDLFFAQNQSSGSADAEKEIFEQIVKKDISADLAQLPAKWEKVAWLCLERNPVQRVKSAEELLSVLNGAAPIPTPPKQPIEDEETKVYNKQQSGQNHSNDSTKIEEVKPETRNLKPETTPPPEKKKNKILIPSLIFGVLLAVVLFIWQPWNSQPETQNPQPETSQPETSNSKPETQNSKPETSKPETSNSKPETSNSKPETSKLKIGDTHAGGIIFYLDGTGQHGLVCAPYDQSTISQWGCFRAYKTDVYGTSTSIGSGQSNTNKIVNACSDSDCAARICSNLVLNGYSDWFLPSKDELNLIYINLTKNGLGGFAKDWYWSSSEYSGEQLIGAWGQDYSSGVQSDLDKDGMTYVRAVRAF